MKKDNADSSEESLMTFKEKYLHTEKNRRKSEKYNMLGRF